jgi:hypothetical protein
LRAGDGVNGPHDLALPVGDVEDAASYGDGVRMDADGQGGAGSQAARFDLERLLHAGDGGRRPGPHQGGQHAGHEQGCAQTATDAGPPHAHRSVVGADHG